MIYGVDTSQPQHSRCKVTQSGWSFDFFDDVFKPVSSAMVNAVTGGYGGKYVGKVVDWISRKEGRTELKQNFEGFTAWVNAASIYDLHRFFLYDVKDAVASTEGKDPWKRLYASVGVSSSGWTVDKAIRAVLCRSWIDAFSRVYLCGALHGLVGWQYGPRAGRECIPVGHTGFSADEMPARVEAIMQCLKRKGGDWAYKRQAQQAASSWASGTVVTEDRPWYYQPKKVALAAGIGSVALVGILALVKLRR